MFSVQQKRDISDAVQKILRATNHPELPTTGEISFMLRVDGAEAWSYAEIKDNASVGDPGVNPHNELMASIPPEESRMLLDKAKEIANHPDPRNTPNDFRQEMLKQQFATLLQRVQKVEAIIIDYNKRLGRMEDRDVIKDKLYSEMNSRLDRLEEYLTPIMEDNLIAHHDDQLRNLNTAIRQLGNPQINKTLKGD